MELEHEPTIEESKAFATGFFQGAQLVSGYMKDCFRMIEDVEIKSETRHRSEHLKGLWQRAYAWMHTVGKLNNPLDFQALAIANRALLEITVDLVLLHHDETNLSGWKMHGWGFSEKLKACEQIIKFYGTQGLDVPDQYDAQVQFYQNERYFVEAQRTNLWPNKKGVGTHPKRWTGNSNLFDDIAAADQLYGSVIESNMGSTLVEYYRTEYRKLNWNIHSGVPVWQQPAAGFNLMSGSALKCCGDLAMLCTKIVLIDFELVFEGVKDRWDDIDLNRNLLYLEAMNPFPNRDPA